MYPLLYCINFYYRKKKEVDGNGQTKRKAKGEEGVSKVRRVTCIVGLR